MEKKTVEKLNLEITIHNEREDLLFNVFKSRVKDLERYYLEQTFKDETNKICERIARELEYLTTAMYYLNMTEKIMIDFEILKCLKIV